MIIRSWTKKYFFFFGGKQVLQRGTNTRVVWNVNKKSTQKYALFRVEKIAIDEKR